MHKKKLKKKKKNLELTTWMLLLLPDFFFSPSFFYGLLLVLRNTTLVGTVARATLAIGNCLQNSVVYKYNVYNVSIETGDRTCCTTCNYLNL